MLCAPAGIVEDIKFTLYDTGRWTFLDEKEEFVPRLLIASYEVRLFPLARIAIAGIPQHRSLLKATREFKVTLRDRPTGGVPISPVATGRWW